MVAILEPAAAVKRNQLTPVKLTGDDAKLRKSVGGPNGGPRSQRPPRLSATDHIALATRHESDRTFTLASDCGHDAWQMMELLVAMWARRRSRARPRPQMQYDRRGSGKSERRRPIVRFQRPPTTSGTRQLSRELQLWQVWHAFSFLLRARAPPPHTPPLFGGGHRLSARRCEDASGFSSNSLLQALARWARAGFLPGITGT
jgi:hypothetical protein